MVGGKAVVAVGVFLFSLATFGSPDTAELESLRAELIPAPGSGTSYGIPLSLAHAQTFADWFYTIQLDPEEMEAVTQVLQEIPAPCCDDNSVLRCCCRKSNRICNLTRSAIGLAYWLVHHKGFTGDELREAVEEWLRFLKPNYYLALALEERGSDPRQFGLAPHEAYESCDARKCEAPLDAGGCGGMGLQVLLEREQRIPECCRSGERG